jgi:hypothetical protein
MNTNIAVVLLAVCGALAFSAGCGKNEGIPPPAAKTTQTPADAAAAQSQKAAEAQRKADATKTLGELANLKLTPEQQALVDGLNKTAEQQAAQAVSDKAAAGATQAIGDVLGGKKEAENEFAHCLVCLAVTPWPA